MIDDYSDLIGIPFEYRARGPDAYDCYGIALEMYRRRRNIILPDYKKTPRATPGINRLMIQEAHRWKQVERQPNVLVLVKIHSICSHVAFTLDMRHMLHASEELGQVAVDKIDSPDFKHRVVGFYDIALAD